jgi:hypothetical protein
MVYFIYKEIAMDFKFHLAPLSEECFYHSLKTTDSFHVILHVLAGGNLMINFRVRDPQKKEIHYNKDTTFSWYDNAELALNGKNLI